MPAHVTPAGVFIPVGGVLHRLPATATPLRDWIELAAAAGELQPCPHCGEVYGCDCGDWLEWMAANADPHGDLSVFADMEIPF